MFNFKCIYTYACVRALMSMDAKFLSILQKKHVFFYFTHLLLQNTYISLSILHIYSIKYLFLNHLTQYPSLSLSDPTLPKITNTQPPSTINPHPPSTHPATINEINHHHQASLHYQPTHQNPKTTNQNHQNPLIKIIKHH